MTVLEVVRQYGLADYSKAYYSANGNRCDTRYPLDKLTGMLVKSISINFPTKEVKITLMYG